MTYCILLSKFTTKNKKKKLRVCSENIHKNVYKILLQVLPLFVFTTLSVNL